MKKKTIILADTDYGYLEALELKFIEVLRNNVEWVVLTDPEYFKLYFSTQKEAAVLVVSETLYCEMLHLHEFERIVVLSENSSSPGSRDGLIWMNKYANAKTIVNEAVYGLALDTSDGGSRGEKSTVVTVCSPIGGAGKTTVALGLCRCLAKQHRKVLYVNTETIVSFHYYLANKSRLDMDVCRQLRSGQRPPFEILSPYVRQEEFYYLPPLPATAEFLQLPLNMYTEFIRQARDTGQYDYIVVDTDNGCSPATAGFIALGDIVTVVVCQDGLSAAKCGFFMENIDCSDSERFLFVCNRYNPGDENALPEVPGIRLCEPVEIFDGTGDPGGG